MSTKQLTLRIPYDIHKQFKILAAHEGKTMVETFISLIQERMGQQGHDEDLPDCPLCRKYGNIPNAETIKALEEDEDSLPSMTGEEYLAKLDKEFGKKKK